jgi:hypothetical protein
MLRVPRVGYSLPVTPLKSICRRADYFCDDEGSLPWGRELVHTDSLLDVVSLAHVVCWHEVDRRGVAAVGPLVPQVLVARGWH